MSGSAPARPRRRLAVTTVGVLVALVGGALGVAGLVQHEIASHLEYFDDPFESLTDRPEPVEQPQRENDDAPASGTDGEPVDILVLGSDSRISAGDPSAWEYGAQRTDAIMLVHIAGDRQSAQAMSIPRDAWVPIPGYGHAKVNAAFSFGGPPLLVQTVEQLTGVRIDHVAIADFESFAELTDALGGVRITLPDGMDSRGVELEPGTRTLTGEQALVYVRERYDLPRGDLDRVQRQQNWIRAILRAAFDGGIPTDPIELTSFVTTGADALSVDERFTVATMRDLLLSMRSMRPDDLTFLTVPVSGLGRSDDGQSIVELDMQAFDSLMASVAADDVAAHLHEHPELEVLGSSSSVP